MRFNVFSDGIKFTKKLEDIETDEKDDILFTCEISDSNVEVKWFRDNTLLTSDHRVLIGVNGKAHSLFIPWTCLADSGTYKALAGFSKSIAKLTVNGKLRYCLCLVYSGALGLPRTRLFSPDDWRRPDGRAPWDSCLAISAHFSNRGAGTAPPR